MRALGVSELIFDFRSDSLSESLARMESFGGLIRDTASVWEDTDAEVRHLQHDSHVTEPPGTCVDQHRPALP